MQEEFDTLFVTEEEAGERLDKILASRLRQAGSRTYFQYLIEEGKVLLNGVPIKKRSKPKAGDEIEVEYILTPELTLEPENIPINIIYEDESILVVNKAPGMVVHPATGHWTGTFVNALLFHCAKSLQGSENTLRPGIVHRLDKDTSGLMVAAKTSAAQQKLIEMFAGRQVYKEYLAICIGNPKDGVIESPIGRHPVNRKLMAVLGKGEGKPALTRYHSIGFNERLSLVNVVIETGRTHQIRVHMKYHGTPILGDPLYGVPSFNAKLGVERQMLHAYKLRLNHPISGKLLEWTAEIPQDMQKIIRQINPKEKS